MALPTTGPLSGKDINDEFPDSVDGGLPMQLSEYRGVRASKGGLSYTLPAAPNSIAYSDFRGVAYGYNIDILIVGGGGGGGGGTGTTDSPSQNRSGGGGGAGGLRIISNIFAIPGDKFNIKVGKGGIGRPSGIIQDTRVFRGENGTSTTFTVGNTVYSVAGGGGGGGGRDDSQQNGANGASGGGGGGFSGRPAGSGGSGTANRGNNGGAGDRTINSEGGGGGGFSGVGGTAIIGSGDGDGGSGYNLNNFMGNANYRGNNGGIAGGGGGGRTTSPEGGGRGSDGGGNGAFRSLNISGRGDSVAGANLTGGGGGGGCEANGSSEGGTGVVIVRYQGTTSRTSDGTVYTGSVGGVNYVFHVFGKSSGNDELFTTFNA
jgi:hypothetical protein